MTKVLVVDDDSLITDFVGEILTSKGYDVLTCNGGEKALDIASRQRPDLIILDVMMPRVDGYQVLWHLGNEQRTKDIPTIVLTARTGEADVHQGLKLGAREYMFKPFMIDELLERVDTLMGPYSYAHA